MVLFHLTRLQSDLWRALSVYWTEDVPRSYRVFQGHGVIYGKTILGLRSSF